MKDTNIYFSEELQEKRLEGKLGKTRFAKDTFTLFSGTAIAQLVSTSATPVVTRLFAPDAFGLFAMVLTIIGIIGIIACMRYELSIVLPKDDHEAGSLFWASIFFTLVITTLIVSIIIFSGEYILKLLNTPDIKSYIWLIPIGILFQGIFSALNHWNTRTRHFKRLAIAQVNNSLTKNAATIGIGAAGYTTAGGLIGGNIFGSIMATIVLGAQIWRDDSKLLLNSLRLYLIKENIVKYKRMALLNAPASLINLISQKLPTLLLVIFFSPAVVGYYALSYQLLKMPTQLVGESVRKVFFQRASESVSVNQSVKGVVENTFKNLFRISFGPFIVIFIISPYIFSFIFGENWLEAGVYARWLIPWVFAGFLVVPMSSIISVSGKESVGLLFQTLTLMTRIVVVLLGGLLFKDPLITILLFSIVGVLYQLLMLRWILNECDANIINNLIGKWMALFTLLLIVVIGIIEYIYMVDQSIILLLASIYSVYYIINYKYYFINLIKSIVNEN
jgi:lipopolysaccharide exporter